MSNIKQIFQYISYLQYPIMLVGVYFAIQPYFNDFEAPLESINNTLIFMGLGISFSTLQDTSKTQNEMSRKIWTHPKRGNRFLILMGVTTLFLLVVGMVGLFSDSETLIGQLGFGILVVAIGLMGMLKTASEMFEHHRMDRP